MNLLVLLDIAFQSIMIFCSHNYILLIFLGTLFLFYKRIRTSKKQTRILGRTMLGPMTRETKQWLIDRYWFPNVMKVVK
jgi:uncharacterized membrane protein